MSRSATTVRLKTVSALVVGAAVMAGATVIGLVTAGVLMAPPASDMWELAAYFVLTGTVSLAAGWGILQLLVLWRGLSLRARAVLGATVGGGVALLNVVIVAQLMFVNTGHDLKLLAALALFGGIASLSVSFWAASQVTGRVEEVAATVRRVARGEFDVRVPRSPLKDEVAQLAEDVDTMAVRLRESERQRNAVERERRELTAAISHDLRTPLASIRAMVEALSDGVMADRAGVARYHEQLRREVGRLDRMIDDLFELAQVDAGALQLNRQHLALQEIAAEAVDSMQPRAEVAGVQLLLRVQGEPPRLAVDGARLERAVSNLLRNALEHTPAGGTITVTVASDEDGVTVEVADSGPGIHGDDMPRIWERFYRGDTSRMKSAIEDGAGLGLAIVRGFVEAHGGSVGVESEMGHGATFRITIPAAV